MIDFREFKEFIKDTLAYIVLLSVIAFIFIFVIAIVPIAGNSMNPTLNDANMTIVLRFAYIFNGPKRGDIINIVTKDKQRFVKRIIGLPGEEIHYVDNILYVDGKNVSESYLKSSVETYSFTLEDICKEKECPNKVIPEDKYLVLGDNRENSSDSRDPEIGLVSKDQINGKVVLKIWPFNEFTLISK